MKSFVTVIVPCYNVEKYICRCMDSIIHQTYRKFEVIAVNDGSTDETGRILDEYAATYHFIHIIHSKNKGVSHARNLAIKEAKGEYLTFVDADDYIASDFLDIMTDKDSDMTICGYKSFGLLSDYFTLENKTYLKSDYKTLFDKYLNRAPLGTPWGILFSRDIIDRYHILFNESLIIGEDMVFNQTFLLHAKTISTIDYEGYHYYTFNKRMYQLNESQHEIHFKAWNDAYLAICCKFNYSNIVFESMIHNFLHFLYYTYQCNNKFSFKGWHCYSTYIKKLDKSRIGNQEKNLYSLTIYLEKKNLMYMSFFIIRILHPIFHGIKLKYKYWINFQY